MSVYVTMYNEVFYHNPNTGKVHRACVEGIPPRRFTMEACQFDQIENLQELADFSSAAVVVEQGGSWCDNCVPLSVTVTTTFTGDEDGKPEALEVSELPETESPLSFPGDAAESETDNVD